MNMIQNKNSTRTYVHAHSDTVLTHILSFNSLVWGSLKLAPISAPFSY